MRNVIAALIVLSMAARVVEAQTVIGGAGWTSAWDDETNLGKGVLLSGGIAQSLGRHLSLEGEVSWARHLRDSGYLAAEGARLSAPRGSRMRSRDADPARERSRAPASASCIPRGISPRARLFLDPAAFRSTACRLAATGR